MDRSKIEQIERLSPERLIRMFSASPVILAWVLSIVIHAVLLAGTSWDDVMATVKHEKRSWEKKTEAAEPTNAAPSVASSTGAVASATGTVTTATGTVSTAAGVTNTSGTNLSNLTTVATNEAVEGSHDHEAAMLRKYSNSVIVQEITAVASTNEIPKGPPDDLGIKIEDTDPFNKK